MKGIVIIDPDECEHERTVHFKGRPSGYYVSLCGWCDVNYEEVEGEITCQRCLDIIEWCSRIKNKAVQEQYLIKRSNNGQ